MLFSEVTGHKNIKDVLMRTVTSRRIGHAYIFEGPSGVGKLDMAKAFAMTLLCENTSDGCACGVCKSCSMFRSGNHPDVQVVTNQLYDSSKKSTDILVDTVRSMKQEIYIKPFSAERKVYIVPKADTMNMFAQNSLLKVLEEPPEYCTIILLAENSNSFLPTILSRAPVLKFFPLKPEDVFGYLEQNFPDTPDEILQMSANMSGGSLKRAKILLENDEANELRCGIIDCVVKLYGKSRKSIYDLSKYLKQNKDDAEFLFSVLQEFFHDVMLIKISGLVGRVTNADKMEQIEELADLVTEETPQRLLEILFKYNDYISKNISYAQIVQCMSLELWEAINDRGYRSKIQ